MNSRSKPTSRIPASQQVSPSRAAAYSILKRVSEKNAYASVLLSSLDDELDSRDRGLCYEIVLGVLRWQLWLDRLIENFSGRRIEKLDLEVRIALRIGLYQLRFLSRIPKGAAVNESVKLIRNARLRSAEGFVNAVLRRATLEPNFDPSADIDDPLERLAVSTSHPYWLIERWMKQFDLDWVTGFAQSNNHHPPTSFRIIRQERNEENVLSKLRAVGGYVQASSIARSALRVKAASDVLRELADEGLVYLQDEASQLVVQALDSKEGERILDVCAAPGSKTTLIGDMTANRSEIVAGDLHPHRLITLVSISKRLGISNIHSVALDATHPLPFASETFDRVLVDAPCSGTGTLRGNPEIRWRLNEESIEDLVQRQRAILSNSSKTLRHGGRLIYSTCSVERDENEAVVRWFLDENPGFSQIELDVPERLITDEGNARTWPQRDGSDGFFLAGFIRRTI